jgi:hypothetical protein
LRILEIQQEGKKRMSIEEFLRGFRSWVINSATLSVIFNNSIYYPFSFSKIAVSYNYFFLI